MLARVSSRRLALRGRQQDPRFFRPGTFPRSICYQERETEEYGAGHNNIEQHPHYRPANAFLRSQVPGA